MLASKLKTGNRHCCYWNSNEDNDEIKLVDHVNMICSTILITNNKPIKYISYEVYNI